MPAAKAAYAAFKQGRFWEMHDKLFDNQQALNPKTYDKYARDLRLDMKKFHADMKRLATEAAIKADSDQGNKAGASGTPTFFIDGRRVLGSQPTATFETLIDEEIRKNRS
jgi:protein-disulfide isomerase